MSSTEAISKPIPVVRVDELRDHIGDEVFVKGVLASAEVGKTSKGSSFVKFVLMDRSGEVEGRIWNSVRLPGEPGDVIGFRGRADEFNQRPQLVFISSRPLPDEDPDEYVIASHLEASAIERALGSLMQEFDGDAMAIVREVFAGEGLRSAFMAVPAASRNHHAYARGLAEHTLSMVCAARSLVRHYRDFYGDPIDEALVVAGVLLHDAGKVLEYEREGLLWGTSVAGELVGHIPFMDAMILEAARKVEADPSVVLRLRHIVLSHHGRKDFGSPVEPKTLEAQIVHQVDMLDSRMGMMREALKSARGEVSEWVRPLGGRVVGPVVTVVSEPAEVVDEDQGGA